MDAPSREVPPVEELRERGLAAGLDAIGITTADAFPEVQATLEARKAQGLHGGMAFTYRRPARSTDPGQSLPDVRSLVVGARSYLVDAGLAPPDGAGPQGRVARYAWEDHYAHVRAALTEVGAVLRAAGWRTRVLVDDNALVDRAAAQRAGLASWGKNANLLLPRVGSWYVLGSLLTDAPLPPDPPATADPCGTCTRCLDGCPTGAITAPGVVDARRCLSWLLQAEGAFPAEHRVALGDRIYGCDECQEVCPPNRRAPQRPASGAEQAWVPLVHLLDPDDAVVLAWAERWYIPRREVRYVRRNALVVLGNVGRPDDPVVVDALERHLRHADELLRAHAVWAARRLGREDLLAGLVGGEAPMVAAELAAAVRTR